MFTTDFCISDAGLVEAYQQRVLITPQTSSYALRHLIIDISECCLAERRYSALSTCTANRYTELGFLSRLVARAHTSRGVFSDKAVYDKPHSENEAVAINAYNYIRPSRQYIQVDSRNLSTFYLTGEFADNMLYRIVI